MLRIFLIFFLPAILFVIPIKVIAQTGSLGDPVYTEDFGSGPNPGEDLGSAYTNMQFTTGCPDDGQYTIVSSLNTSNNCHPDTWQYVPHDHTGNPNGYMMLINATKNQPGIPQNIFFTVPVPTGALCPSTTYQFSAYILNLINYSKRDGNIEPDISFNVTTVDGTPLIPKPIPTGPIPSNDPSNPNDPAWKQYSITFSTPPNVTTVVVSMTNNANGGNGNDLVLDDIAFRAYGPVIQAGFNNPTNPAPPLCDGDPANFTVSASVQANVFTSPSYQWQQNIYNAGWTDIPGETATSLARNFPAINAGVYQYRLGVAESTNITTPSCRVYSEPLVINVYNKPVAILAPTQPPVCEGNTLSIEASGGLTYKWTKPDGSTSTQNPLIINNVTPPDAGPYRVVAYSQYCSSPPVQTQVIINSKPVGKATGGTTICAGTTTPLHALGGVSYSWSPGKSLSDSTIANPMASPVDTVTYKVAIKNIYGCADTEYVTVNTLKDPVANAGPNKVIFEGQSVQLTATAQNANAFSWTPITGLSDPNVLNPIASPTDNTTYTLQVSSTQGCGIDKSNVFVKVYKKIVIPNSFSPNGDGINDDWNIEALITYPQCVITVFNRYGQQVFHSIGYGKPWRGKYSGGDPVPTGTYYYVLDLKNNTPVMSGWVAVIR